MTKRARAASAIAITVACGACTLVTSLDGLSGGTTGPVDGGGARDAGTPPVDAIAPPFDAGTLDASEAGPDASSDAGPPYCASLAPQPVFCDDFDEGPLKTPWDHVSSTGGVAALADGAGLETSPPYAMLVSTTGLASLVDVAAYKTFGKVVASQTLTLSFDLRVIAADETQKSDAVVGSIQIFDAVQNWDLQLELQWNAATGAFDGFLSEDGTLGDGGSKYQQSAGSVVALDTWTHVTIEEDIGLFGTPTLGKISFDGATPIQMPLHATTTTAADYEMIVGVTYVPPSSAAWAVRYDDVTFDVH